MKQTRLRFKPAISIILMILMAGLFTACENPADSVNSAPVVTISPSENSISEGETVTITISASDEDGDTVTSTVSLSADYGTLSATSITGSGSLSFTCHDEVTSESATLVFTATPNDGTEDGSAVTATLTINNLEESKNTAPSVSLASSDSDNSVVAGTSVTYTATASDSDGDTLSYNWYVNGSQQTDKTGTSFSYTHSTANSSGDVIKSECFRWNR